MGRIVTPLPPAVQIDEDRAPLATDDRTQGIRVGTNWLWGNRRYICRDDSPGAALWFEPVSVAAPAGALEVASLTVNTTMGVGGLATFTGGISSSGVAVTVGSATAGTGPTTQLIVRGNPSGDPNRGGEIQMTNPNGPVSRFMRVNDAGAFQLLSTTYGSAVTFSNTGILTLPATGGFVGPFLYSTIGGTGRNMNAGDMSRVLEGGAGAATMTAVAGLGKGFNCIVRRTSASNDLTVARGPGVTFVPVNASVVMTAQHSQVEVECTADDGTNATFRARLIAA